MIEIDLFLDDKQREKVAKALRTDGWLADIAGGGVRVRLRPRGGDDPERKSVQIKL